MSDDKKKAKLKKQNHLDDVFGFTPRARNLRRPETAQPPGQKSSDKPTSQESSDKPQSQESSDKPQSQESSDKPKKSDGDKDK